jgi:hypothetical protein
MVRVLLILLSLAIAVLAFALNQFWLYVAAGVALAVTLGVLGVQLWRAYTDVKARQSGDYSPSAEGRQASLEQLGITEVRPQSQRPQDAEDTAPPEPPPQETPDVPPAPGADPSEEREAGAGPSSPSTAPGRTGESRSPGSAPPAPDWAPTESGEEADRDDLDDIMSAPTVSAPRPITDEEEAEGEEAEDEKAEGEKPEDEKPEGAEGEEAEDGEPESDKAAAEQPADEAPEDGETEDGDSPAEEAAASTGKEEPPSRAPSAGGQASPDEDDQAAEARSDQGLPNEASPDEDPSSKVPADEEATPSDEERPPADAAPERRSASDVEPAPEDEKTRRVAKPSTTVAASTADADVLLPYMQSLQAAIQARTVCLLVQERMALEYRIEAIVSQSDQVRDAKVFETRAPLLTATMSRQPVTVREVTDDEATDLLGYYVAVPAVRQVTLAPVPRPSEPSTHFLVADAPATTDLGTPRSRTLVERFAELLGMLLEADNADAVDTRVPALDTSDAPAAPEGRTIEDTLPEEAPAQEAPPDDAPDAQDAMRPRREIIADEMEAARAEQQSLAMTLVHLNRAEALARRSDDAVEEAEAALGDELRDVAPHARIERFGELTYGLFFDAPTEAVEKWAVQFQDDMSRRRGLLEGGVSIGVAMLGDRHETPEALREDATEALREAYETGTCTIVE